MGNLRRLEAGDVIHVDAYRVPDVTLPEDDYDLHIYRLLFGSNGKRTYHLEESRRGVRFFSP